MAWCRQATSHYLSQCWPSSLSTYGVSRPQWVNFHDAIRHHTATKSLHSKDQIRTITNTIVLHKLKKKLKLCEKGGCICTVSKTLSQTLCTALPAGKWLPLGLCKGTVSGIWKNVEKFPPVTWAHNALHVKSSPIYFWIITNHTAGHTANWRSFLIPHWLSY